MQMPTPFTCPECNLELEITPDLLGQHVECPECGVTFTVPSDLFQATEAPSKSPGDRVSSAGSPKQGGKIVFSRGEVQAIKEQAARVHEKSELARADSEYFAPEKKAMEGGVLGGLGLMVVAVVWFVVGYALGYIFYYPPILFFLGLFTFVKGLFTGNLVGKKNKQRP